MIADVFHFVDPVQKAVKVLHDMTPNYLRQLISVLPDSGILLASELRSPLGIGRLVVPSQLWNLLPSTMRSISSLNLFKNRLKTLLFSKAFNN